MFSKLFPVLQTRRSLSWQSDPFNERPCARLWVVTLGTMYLGVVFERNAAMYVKWSGSLITNNTTYWARSDKDIHSLSEGIAEDRTS